VRVESEWVFLNSMSRWRDGIALCGFCRVRVLEGLENLTPAESEEQKILAAEHAGSDERLACCARIHGPVIVTADYW